MDTPNEQASGKVYFTLMFLFVVGLIAWISYANYENDKIVSAGGLATTVGTIIVCESPDRNYLSTIQYEYHVNDSAYVGFDRVACSWCDCAEQKTCLGKKFSVVYANADPSHSSIKLDAPQSSE